MIREIEDNGKLSQFPEVCHGLRLVFILSDVVCTRRIIPVFITDKDAAVNACDSVVQPGQHEIHHLHSCFKLFPFFVSHVSGPLDD
jgi:hypothetical protein